MEVSKVTFANRKPGGKKNCDIAVPATALRKVMSSCVQSPSDCTRLRNEVALLPSDCSLALLLIVKPGSVFRPCRPGSLHQGRADDEVALPIVLELTSPNQPVLPPLTPLIQPLLPGSYFPISGQ